MKWEEMLNCCVMIPYLYGGFFYENLTIISKYSIYIVWKSRRLNSKREKKREKKEKI